MRHAGMQGTPAVFPALVPIVFSLQLSMRSAQFLYEFNCFLSSKRNCDKVVNSNLLNQNENGDILLPT